MIRVVKVIVAFHLVFRIPVRAVYASPDYMFTATYRMPFVVPHE
jgi:hypothetical protein